MKAIKRYAPQIISVLAWVSAVTIAIVIRFSHPEMTETQLLLNYPAFWAIVAFLALLGGYLFPR